MPVKIPTVQTGLEASIQSAAKKAGRNLKINMGGNAKSIEGLSQPLGRITGKADQFTKSMEAANARVLAFGASVGILAAVTRGFKELVLTTIEVEKSLISINSILGTNAKELEGFSKTIFNVARNTEQSFNTVATAALELSRQGLNATEVQKRLADSMILTRVSGLGATEAVSGLTAAINSFNKSGLSSSVILNKLSAAAVAAAVSERDLIEGIKRAGSVASLAGVSFDELVGVITAVQVKTARGGAVIGNSFKTIFTRIQSIEKLETMQNLGVQVTDTSGKVLGATKIIQNLSKVLGELPEAKRLQIAEGLVGKFQISPFLALLDDYNDKTSKAINITKVSQNATTEAYERNLALNEALSAAINVATLNVKELADTLGRIGVTDNLQNLLGFFNTLVENVKGVLDGEGAGGDFARGIVKGIGAVISGPGLAIFGAIIIKLGIDLAKFGLGSLKTFFGLNQAAREQATLQGQIASTLLGNKSIQESILAIENSSLSAEKKKVEQTKFFTTAIKEQLAVMRKMQGIAMKVAPGVRNATKGGRAAGGFIPNYNAIAGYGSESSDISKGVGGAPTSAKPVTIPNFNFGGGQKGTMVANSSEYVVPNYAGSGGSAIFNQDMISSMGMPAGARKISAAGGYIPNYAEIPATFSKYIRQRIPSAFATGSFKSSVAANSLNIPSSEGQMRNLYASSSLRNDFDKLSPTARRALTVTSRQTAVIGKGTEHRSNYGILYPDAKGGTPAKTVNAGKYRVRAIPVATEPSDILYKEVRKSLVSAASKYAEKLGFNPDIVKEKKFKQAVDRNLNEGSVEGAFGTVFEAAFQGAIGTDQKSNTRWDLRSPEAIKTLLSRISSKGLLSKTVGPELAAIKKADFKNTLSAPNLTSIAGKIKNSPFKAPPVGKAGKASGGYIPNFANPLQDAIGREQAAGLPVNQIRINQSPKLRNAGNPMGLAVTNTRDEPTGAIPNFAQYRNPSGQFAKRPPLPTGKTLNIGSGTPPQLPNSTIKQIDNLGKSADKAAKSTDKTAKGQRDMLGGIFATQIAFSALAGATSDMDEGFGRFANRITTLGSSLTTAAFAGSAINDFGKSIDGAGGKLVSKLGIYGAAIGGVIAAFGAGKTILQDYTGVTDRTSAAMDKLTDVSKELAGSFEELSAVEEGQFKRQGENLTNSSFFERPEAVGTIDKISQFLTQKFVNRDFSNDDVEKGFTQTSINFLKLGKTTEQVEKMLQRFGENLTVGELDFFIDESRRLNNQINSDIAAFKKTLLGLSEEDLERELKTPLVGESVFPNLNPKRRAEAVGEEKDLRKIKTDKDEKENTRISNQIAKQDIANAVALAKLERDMLNTLEDQFSVANKAGILGTDERKNAIIEIANAKQQFDLRNKTLDTIEKISAESRELTQEEGVNKDLVQQILGLSEGAKDTEEDRKKILLDIQDLLKNDTTNIKAKIGPLLKALGVSEKELEIVKERAVKEAEITALVNNRGDSRATVAIREATKDKNAGSDAQLRLRSKIESRTLSLQRGGNTPLSITQSRAKGVSDSIIKQEIVSLENQLKTITREEGQRGELRAFLQNPKVARIFDGDREGLSAKQKITEINKLEGNDLILEFQKLAERVEFESNWTGQLDQQLGKLAAEIDGNAEAFRRNNETAEQAANGNSNLAKAAVDAAKKIGSLLDFSQLVGDKALSLREGATQGGIDAEMTIDPAARIKARRSEKSRNKRADALDAASENGDFEPYRKLVENDEFSGKLVDASAQFAHNIGDAMTQAIIQGGNLSDILIGTATSFFTTLSKAYMTKAVDSVIGKFAAGGKVTGGSGNRDDVPALLMGGEFVMKKSSVSKYGSSFMESLNAGSIPAMARGGLFTPGTNGQEEIKGKSNLIDFATQSFTTGASDRFGSGAGSASVNLEPQSAALTMFGRRNSPAFQREQDSKRDAFGLFTQQVQKEEEAREQKKEAKKALKNAIFGAVVSAGFSALETKFSKPKKISTLSESLTNTTQIQGLMDSLEAYKKDSVMFNNSVPDSMLSRSFATGGSVPNTAGVDTVPSMLSGGEFVMNAAATQKIGAGNLNALNSGAGGGSEDIVSKLDELISVSDNAGETVINITVNSDGSSDTQGGGGDGGGEQQRSLATRIKDVVKQVIDDEKRLGGSLRQARA